MANATLTYRRWIATFSKVLVAAGLFIGLTFAYAYHVVTQPGFFRHFGDPSIWTQDQPFRMHDQNCEVLAFGDSTAATGIDPRVVTARTGLTACNISVTRPVIDYVDMLPVDVFLEHNPHPRFLVLQFGPEDFYRRAGWDHDPPFATMVLILRNMPMSYWLPRFLAHPVEVTQFALYTTQTELLPKPRDEVSVDRKYDDLVGAYQASRGLFTFGVAPVDHCVGAPVPLYGPLDTRWIEGLRAKYSAMGIAVILRAAPLAPCDPQFSFFQHDLAPYVDIGVESIPVQYFEPGGRHPTPAGAAIGTERVAQFIQEREQNTSGPIPQPTRTEP